MEFEVDAVFNERKINDVCRTCLAKDGQMSSVFQRYEDDAMNVNEIIMEFCSIEIKPNDGLSEMICRACIVEAKNASLFKKKCEEAQNTLQKYKICFQKDMLSTVLKEESNHSSFSEFSFRSNNDDTKYKENRAACKSQTINSIEVELKDSSLLLNDFDLAKVKVEDSDDIIQCLIKRDDEYLLNNEDIKKMKRSLKHKKKNSPTKGSRKKLKLKPESKVVRRNKTSTIRYCDFCQFKSKLPSQLTKHMHTHTGEKPLSCDLCDFRCIQKSSLHNHQFVHGNIKPYSCTLCEYRSTNSSNLKRHVRRHTGDKPYSCDLCSYRCVQSTYLEEHKRTHTGEKPFLCDQCHYRCTTNSCLKTHKRNKHQTQKRYACDECDFKAKSRSTLISHIRTHTGDKRYVCDQCPYRAIQLATLNNHKMMVHTGERPFACEQCSYRTISLGYLKNHMKCHQTMKSFSCEECGYMCHTSYKLKTHRRTHTGEKPYLCATCDFKSASSSSLKRHHKRNHTLLAK